MILPARLAKKPKRESRWKSTRHRDWVRGFACCNCGETAGVQVAHVRMGSGAGMGQKPDDWRTVPLCGDCHNGEQHTKLGEPEFWARYAKTNGHTVFDLIDELARKSPLAREIKEKRCGR